MDYSKPRMRSAFAGSAAACVPVLSRRKGKYALNANHSRPSAYT